MRKFIPVLVLLILKLQFLSGQNDPQAVSILDKFSARVSAAPSVSISFLFVRNDQMQKSVDTLAGSVVLSKDSYKLELPDNVIWYNGKTSWSLLPAEEEVTITEPDPGSRSFEARPSMIFNMYREGYKCRLLEEKSNSYLIDLYPTDVKNDIIRVRLTIAKPSLDLKSFEYKLRDGIEIKIAVTDLSLAKTVPAGFFEFDPKKHKGVDIIDMR
ncbi:MAG: outer membrane lipoprotein carrier protein LolA [Bacteroidales bacterium]|jgi:outer membrane lipoprotein-sorting protein|nr:outer membrane lipoprotein carrier protein LolA [Bacteroidales bacterium]